jgi:phosphomannomutase
MSKQKVQLTEDLNVDALLELMANNYKNEDVDCTDGVKINFNEEWVHLRKSNTEPIIRIYTESATPQKANALALRFIKEISDLKL